MKKVVIFTYSQLLLTTLIAVTVCHKKVFAEREFFNFFFFLRTKFHDDLYDDHAVFCNDDTVG